MKETEFKKRHNMRMMEWGKREVTRILNSGDSIESAYDKLIKPSLKAFNEGVFRTSEQSINQP